MKKWPESPYTFTWFENSWITNLSSGDIRVKFDNENISELIELTITLSAIWLAFMTLNEPCGPNELDDKFNSTKHPFLNNIEWIFLFTYFDEEVIELFFSSLLLLLLLLSSLLSVVMP